MYQPEQMLTINPVRVIGGYFWRRASPPLLCSNRFQAVSGFDTGDSTRAVTEAGG